MLPKFYTCAGLTSLGQCQTLDEAWYMSVDLQTEKKTHSLKAENYVLLRDLTEDYSLDYSLLDGSEELFHRG